MSEELWRSYNELRTLDRNARLGKLAESDRPELHDKWWEFMHLFMAWIKPWGKYGIVIFAGRQNEIMYENRNMLYLQVESDEAAKNRPRSFPSAETPPYIIELATKLSALLSSNNQLDSTEKSQLDFLLRPLWQPQKTQYRNMLINKITPQGNGIMRILNVEEAAVVEARLTQGYYIWKSLLVDGAQYSQIRFVDRGMGQWEIELGANVISPQAANFLPRHVDVSEDEFLRIAKIIRKKEGLTPQERSKLLLMLEPLSLDRLRELEEDMAQRVVDYWAKDAEGKNLSLLDQSDMQERDLIYLWQRWGAMNETMREEILPEAQVPDAIDRLLKSRLYTQQGQKQVVVLRTGEREELEVEVNNLLSKTGNGTSCGHEGKKLDYILQSLTGPRLRLLRQRIESLQTVFMQSEFVDTTRSLTLVDLIKEYDAGFVAFKKSIPKHGIFLDTWWYEQEVIDEVCSLSRKWNEALKADPHGTHEGRCTGTKIEDNTMREWHCQYTILKAFVHHGENIDGEQQTRLIFHAMPKRLRTMETNIKNLRKIVDTIANREFGENLGLLVDFRSMKEEFIRAYMGWYTKLSQTQIKNPLNKTVTAFGGILNFTGKAERRGIQRAAIELALNLLATNQEQHRPDDRFRILQLPSRYQGPQKENVLSLPLEPWKRPIEQDPFEYTKKILVYQQWKDFDYHLGRTHTANCKPGELQAPCNYNGPFAATTGDEIKEAVRDRQSVLNNYYAILSMAEKATPRPLLQQMLTCATQALTSDSISGNIQDEEFQKLAQKDLDLVEEVAGASWDELGEQYTDDILNGDKNEKKRLLEFERNVEAMAGEIPLWQRPIDTAAIEADDLEINDLCAPVPYDSQVRSETGLAVRDLIQNIRNARLAKTDQANIWTDEEATRYLGVMVNFARIHFDNQNGEEPQVSRVPFFGHPENKYVLDRMNAKFSLGVHYITGDPSDPNNGKLEVQYDSNGFKGPPIVQPNKYEHFLDIATRLGREIRVCLQTRQKDNWPRRQCVKIQWDAMRDALGEMAAITPGQRAQLHADPKSMEHCEISIEALAEELNKFAPDLAEEAGFDWSGRNNYPVDGTGAEKEKWKVEREKQAGAILQTQILEEASNNWELRYPEDEHVWDFAGDRLDTVTRTINGRKVEAIPRIRKFFTMQRWPLCCQSEQVQSVIKASGPTIQGKPASLVLPVQNTREELLAEASRPQEKAARHIKGRKPHFPFGETTYQAGFLSQRMEDDLKNVPEFQPRPVKNNWFTTRPREEPVVNSFKLPDIPNNWNPDNVSKEEKRHSLIDWAKRTPGFPNPEILEYYHTPAEINAIKRLREWDADQAAIRTANMAIEKHLGKKWSKLSREEIHKARAALEIDHFTEKFLPVAANATAGSATTDGTTGGGKRHRKGTLAPVTTIDNLGGPSRNTRSKFSTKKRSASGAAEGEGLSKKKKQVTIVV